MRSRVTAAVILLTAAFAGRADAQLEKCTPVSDVILTSGRVVTPPAGAAQVVLVDEAGARVTDFAQPVEGTWTPSAADLTAIALAKKGPPERTLFLRWVNAGGSTLCDRGFAVVDAAPDASAVTTTGQQAPPVTPVAPGSTAESHAWNEGQCGAAGSQWRQDLIRSTGGEHFTEVVFLENHDVCFRNRDYGVTGDPIYVGVFTKNAAAWDTAVVQYEPCSIEPAAPNVLITDKTSVFSQFLSNRIEWRLRTYPQRSCFNASVAVTVKTRVGTTDVTARTTVDQATRYRATLHLGTLFTTLHDRSFGLRTDGANSRIYGKGPDNRGPEYYAAVVLYALPRYIPSFFGQGHYAGRDVVHDNSVFDRLGGVVGVGIKDPRKQFVAGFAFEVIPGVNLTGTWNYSRVTRLAGVSEGDVFTGTVDTLPTREVWDHDFAWGLSLDLRYVSSLVSR